MFIDENLYKTYEKNITKCTESKREIPEEFLEKVEKTGYLSKLNNHNLFKAHANSSYL